MTDSKISEQLVHSIGAVERATGLGKDTLRAWERRYQFPKPLRDLNDERVYPLDQVNKLRLLKRLLDCGHRPGKIIHFEMEALHKLHEGLVAVDAKPGADVKSVELDDFLALCQKHQVEELRRTLSLSLLRTGLQSFVLNVIAPLNRMVGDYWSCGLFTVYEEHLYTELVQSLLRNAIFTILPPQVQTQVRPRIVLTTFPGEQHGLGLLMAEAMFALEGAHCISLGVQTPVIDLVRAAQMQRADIVALSLSSISSTKALDDLTSLLNGLPAATEVWVGGSGTTLLHRSRLPVRVPTLLEVPTALAEWHQRRHV
jgi:MerR family transcriptional regulator, light-induced transcriptional regulator